MSTLAAPEAPLPAGQVTGATVQNTRRARRGLFIAGVIGLAVAGLAILLLIGAIVGPAAFMTGMLLAFLPVPLYVSLALWIDRYEPEPARMLIFAFVWGAAVATLVAMILNSVGQAIVGSEFGQDVGELFGATVSAPIVEETAKALALFGIYIWRKPEFNGVLDGIVYAAMVGLGFAATENILYYGSTEAEGAIPVEAVFFMRGVLSPFAHPVFTAATGIGLGLALRSKSRGGRIGLPLLGLVCAIGLHALWNASATVGDGTAFFGVYLFIMIPVFAALVAVSFISRSRDGRLIREYLQGDVQSGLIAPQDLAVLSNLRARRRALKAAKATGHKKQRKRFHELATDLAFHRHQVARGVHGGDKASADEQRLTAAIVEIRPQLPAVPEHIVPAGALPLPAGPPPSWYPDPWGKSRLRYWDGTAWTGHVAD